MSQKVLEPGSGDGFARDHPEPPAVGEASYVRDERSEIGKHLSIGSSLNDRLKHISSAFAEHICGDRGQFHVSHLQHGSRIRFTRYALVLAQASCDSA